VKDFQRTYTQKDIQDCLSMVVLTYAVDLYKLQRQSVDDDLTKRIIQIDSLLDQFIGDKKAS
jgi:cell division protein ZapA